MVFLHGRGRRRRNYAFGRVNWRACTFNRRTGTKLPFCAVHFTARLPNTCLQRFIAWRLPGGPTSAAVYCDMRSTPSSCFCWRTGAVYASKPCLRRHPISLSRLGFAYGCGLRPPLDAADGKDPLCTAFPLPCYQTFAHPGGLPRNGGGCVRRWIGLSLEGRIILFCSCTPRTPAVSHLCALRGGGSGRSYVPLL
jgi:hypothetical protein